jgi:stage V sporulation protein D (sporulation-specific penicillin-binding protein)
MASEYSQSTPGMTVRRRLLVLTAVIPVLFLVVLLRIGQLSIVQSEELTIRGIAQWTRNGTVSAARGKVLDRNGKTITQSVTAYIVYASPNQISNPEATADALVAALGVDRASLIAKLNQKGVGSVIVKRQVTHEIIDGMRAKMQIPGTKENPNPLAGISFGEDRLRYYPLGQFFAQALGLTDIDGKGQSGLEQMYNAYLAGAPGRIISEVDAKARMIPGGSEYYVPPKEGASLKTTIDSSIQAFADKAMRECVDVNGAEQAMAIVMDPNTGAILAMSIYPGYDPNTPPRNDLETLQKLMRISTISDAYEPGSTFKMFTASAALDLGLTNPAEGFYCSGKITVDGDIIRCWGAPHGAESMQRALQNSCNPVFVQLGLRLGTENMYKYLKAFGFGSLTGIDLPGESSGIMIPKSSVQTVDLARIGFGQSVAVTPIQMIAAGSAVVNGGKLYKPYIVEEVIAADGEVLERTVPQVVSQPISANTSATMRGLLESVVEDGGGKNAKISGYRISGKTGTAQKYVNGIVSHSVHIGSFMGFAPADDPKLAVIVIVDEATLKPDYGSTTAAPFARQILFDSLQYLGIHEEYADKPQVQVTVPDLTGKTVLEASNALRALDVDIVVNGTENIVLSQLPAPGATVLSGSQVMLYVHDGDIPDAQTLVKVPDVRGMSVVEANRQLRARLLNMKIEGSGIAQKQAPAPGEFVNPGATITVTFVAP